MSRYFYHGVSSIASTLKILQSGSIQCRRLLGKKANGYNGLDYVSVCKKYAEEDYQNTDMNNAFYSCVQGNFCFIVSERVDAIKTHSSGQIKWYDYSDSLLTDKRNRISDMFDEWQAYQEIPLSMIIGVGIPSNYVDAILKKSSSTGRFIMELKEIVAVVTALGLDIVDTNVLGFVEEYEKYKENSSSKVYQISKKLEEVITHE